MSEHSEPASGDAPGSRLTWVEPLLVVVVTLAGFALRSAYPARIAVEHFDEGVYASNYFFSGDQGDERYPDQHLYGPPLVPALIDVSMVLFGPSNVAAIGFGIVAGTLSVPLLWWVGRRWFGPTPGLIAATLVALSDIHILYSRTALTDILLCLFLIAAVHAFWVAQTTSSRLALVASGLLTGLAWWTKYNGWLALAIGLAGVVPWRAIEAWSRIRGNQTPRMRSAELLRPLLRGLVVWVAIAIVAFGVWAPCLLSLQSQGGYSAVAANHRGYVMGLGNWGASLGIQARKLSLLSGPLTGCSGLFAFALALLRLRTSDPRFTWNGLLRSDAIVFAVPVLVLLCVIEGGGVVLAFLGMVGIVIGLVRALPDVGPTTVSFRSNLAAWLLAAWLGGLVVAVPLYMPYPRLVLPLLIACYLGMGVLADTVLRDARDSALLPGKLPGAEPLLSQQRPGERALARARPIFLVALGVGIVAAVMQRSPGDHGVIGWQPRTGLAELAPTIRDDVARHAGVDPASERDQFVIYTYGEPALLFQLRRSGCAYVRPVKDLGLASPEALAPRLASFVAFGPQAWRTPGFGEQLARALPRLHLVGKYRYAPSDVVLLEGPLIRHARRPEYEIEVYLVR